jgi:hypothetical protein
MAVSGANQLKCVRLFSMENEGGARDQRMTSARFLALATCLAAVALLPAGAVATPPQTSSCKDLSEGLLKESLPPASKVQTVGQACLFTHIRFKAGTRQSWTIEQVSVVGLDGWDSKRSKLPPHLQVEAKGILFSPEIDSARMRYQLAVTQRPFDARLQFDWDSAGRQFHLREVALDSPWLGHISLGTDAVLSGQDLPSPSGLGKVQISRVRFVLDNRTVLESMIVPTLLGLIPEDKDPAVEIPKAQAKAERQLREMPQTVIDAASRDALIGFIRDFPHPSGHFELDLTLAEPRSLDSIKVQRKDDDWIGKARISARYEPAPAP